MANTLVPAETFPVLTATLLVAAIPVPDAANELADDILCELRKNGMTVSDRKYLGYYRILLPI